MIVSGQVDVGAALALDAWKTGRFRSLALETQGCTPRVIASGPKGEHVSISCAEELFALIALANAALPATDARKITPSMADAVHAQARELDTQIAAMRRAARRLEHHLRDESEIIARHADALEPMLALLRRVAAVLNALLPGPMTS